MKQFLVLCAVAAACALVAVQFAAGATVGPLAGDGAFTSNPQSASSSCPTGAVVTGLVVGLQNRVGIDFVGSVAVICTAPNGTVTTGSAIGTNGAPITASCTGTDVGLGIYGFTGNVVDGLGPRCGAAGGTATNGPLVWGGGGAPNGPYDCAVGSALTGLTGTYATYFSSNTVVSLTGVCTAVVPTSLAQCKKHGWMSWATYGFTVFKNQGDCVSFVATGGKNQPAG
jgi:hypothetical protein